MDSTSKCAEGDTSSILNIDENNLFFHGRLPSGSSMDFGDMLNIFYVEDICIGTTTSSSAGGDTSFILDINEIDQFLHGILPSGSSMDFADVLNISDVEDIGTTTLSSAGGDMSSILDIDKNDPFFHGILPSGSSMDFADVLNISDVENTCIGTNTTEGVSELLNGRTPTEKVKRPLNSFMVWSVEARKRIASEEQIANHRDISTRLSVLWKSMSEREKQPFVDKAKQLKEEHGQLHPGYKYQPKRRPRKAPSEPAAAVQSVEPHRRRWQDSRPEQQPGPEQQLQQTPTENCVFIIFPSSQPPAAIPFHSAILGLSPQQQTIPPAPVGWMPEIVTAPIKTNNTPIQHPRLKEAPPGWIPTRVVTPKQDRTESASNQEDIAFNASESPLRVKPCPLNQQYNNNNNNNASATSFDSTLLEAFKLYVGPSL